MMTLLVVVVAAFATMTWVSYVTESQRAAARDRARLQAFTAAEAGVEQVIDWFNHPGFFDGAPGYAGATPAVYTTSGWNASPHPAPYSPGDNTGGQVGDYDNDYGLFEPYVLAVKKAPDGQVISETENGESLHVARPTMFTFQRDLTLATNSSKVPSCALTVPDSLSFTGSDGETRAWVTSLVLVHPEDLDLIGDDVPDPKEKAICKVISTATATELNGETITIETLLKENPFFHIVSPGALLSGASAEFDGQFNLHWGEMWAKGDVPLHNGWDSPSLEVAIDRKDKWLKVRTEKNLMNKDGEYANGHDLDGNGFTTTAPGTGHVNYYQPFTEVAEDSGPQTLGQYKDILYQNQEDLDFPEYDYDKVKEFFLSAGMPYYYTGPDGKVYGVDGDPSSATYNQIVGKTFEQWFNITTFDSNYWEDENLYVFIDTVPTDEDGNWTTIENGLPVVNAEFQSRAPGVYNEKSNMNTINDNGTIHTRGAMFIAANLTFGGSGNTNGLSSGTILDPDTGSTYVVNPDGTSPTKSVNVSHNGFMYSWGTIGNSGNRTFYGSVFTEGGFTGSGSREIYYNYRMKDGSWLSINQSLVMRSQWAVRSKSLDLNALGIS